MKNVVVLIFFSLTVSLVYFMQVSIKCIRVSIMQSIVECILFISKVQSFQLMVVLNFKSSLLFVVCPKSVLIRVYCLLPSKYIVKSTRIIANSSLD
jgi:hypothetical protein